MKAQKRDYTVLTQIAEKCGLKPFVDRMGRNPEGQYSFGHLYAPVDLSACAEDEVSILKTAVEQLSKDVDESYHNSIERDFLD